MVPAHYDVPVQNLTGRLQARGWRMTTQRRVISGIFDAAGARHVHLSAEDVLERAMAQLADISRATVYNTLGELVEAGELVPVHVGDRVTRYDPNASTPHHHLVCTECGAIFDVAVPQSDLPVPAGNGFTVDHAEVIFRGRCAVCAAAGSANPAGDGSAPA